MESKERKSKESTGKRKRLRAGGLKGLERGASRVIRQWLKEERTIPEEAGAARLGNEPGAGVPRSLERLRSGHLENTGDRNKDLGDTKDLKTRITKQHVCLSWGFYCYSETP